MARFFFLRYLTQPPPFPHPQTVSSGPQTKYRTRFEPYLKFGRHHNRSFSGAKISGNLPGPVCPAGEGLLHRPGTLPIAAPGEPQNQSPTRSMGSPDEREGKSPTSSWVSFAFVFNLLIGAGALAIPRPFAQTGFVLAAPFLCVLCFLSLLTSLYMVEVLLAVKLITKGEKDASSSLLLQEEDGDDAAGIGLSAPVDENALNAGAITTSVHRGNGAGGDEVYAPLLDATGGGGPRGGAANAADKDAKKLEMGALAKKLFTPLGSKVTYLVLCLYLLGDLSIYTVAIPKSLTALVCPHGTRANAHFVQGMEDWPCKNFQDLPKEHYLRDLTSKTVYRFFVGLLGLVQLPFMFQTVQKTLFIQVLSITYRWSAFFIIVAICLMQMFAKEEDRDWDHFTRRHHFSGLLQLFGVTIYSFMCHHSLPSLLNPMMTAMRPEALELRRIAKPVAWAMASCLLVYLLLNTVVALRFKPEEIEDVITLNFQNFKPRKISVFLELFPVCTLGSSFPIIACTLRNNLQTLVLLQTSEAKRSQFLKVVDKVVLPLVVLICPLLVALVTENVEMLVGLTGSYGGCAIEFIIPTLLVVEARKKVRDHAQGSGGLALSKLDMGVFSSKFFVNLVLTWSVVCLAMVTFNQFGPT